MCRDGNQVRRLKATWSGKLSDSHQQPSMSTTKLKRGIVGVDGASNQVVIQRFSTKHRHAGVDLNLQRPGFVLQDRTIVCWLKLMWLVTVKKERCYS